MLNIEVHKQMYDRGLWTRWVGVVIARRSNGFHTVVARTKPMRTRRQALEGARALAQHNPITIKREVKE